MLAVALLALAGLLVAPLAPAFACSCAAAHPQELVDTATVVVQGTVANVADRLGKSLLQSSGDPVDYTIAVSGVFKGVAGQTVVVTSAKDSAGCGIEVQPGREYVVYARAAGQELRADLCNGTSPATPESVAAVTAVTGPASAPDPSIVSAPPPDSAPQPSVEGRRRWVTAAGLCLGVLLLGAGLLSLRRRPSRS